jgi:hypothetical protein
MKWLLIVGALLIGRAEAATLAVTPGTGATLNMSADGSGNLSPHVITCDNAASATCAGVSAAGTTATVGPGVQGMTGGVPMPMSATALPLPTGAATSANQGPVTAAGTTASTAGAVQGVTGGIPMPVSNASLPLPTGAATAANQSASGTPTQGSVSCGTSSTTLLSAAAATNFILIKIPAGANNLVWFNFAGSAAVTSAPSEDLAAGQAQVWSTSRYLPTAQINCIATAATTVTLIYK